MYTLVGPFLVSISPTMCFIFVDLFLFFLLMERDYSMSYLTVPPSTPPLSYCQVMG
jgi:hypothetical protein